MRVNKLIKISAIAELALGLSGCVKTDEVSHMINPITQEQAKTLTASKLNIEANNIKITEFHNDNTVTDWTATVNNVVYSCGGHNRSSIDCYNLTQSASQLKQTLS